MVRLVFLHGIGDGGITGAWKTTLKDALAVLGYPASDLDDHNLVIAPQYTEYLSQDRPPKCDMPEFTAADLPRDEAARERWEYEGRQASLERLLGIERAPDWPVTIPEVLKSAGLEILVQARRYVKDARFQACILRRVRDHLPVDGEVVIVGHSLGSLIAIDILDQMPPNLVVRRLVTLGSPAGHVVIHSYRKHLLKTFPLARVRSWANVWAALDPVPAGRGIASLFPQALDVRISADASVLYPVQHHAAETYLSHPTVATAVGEAMFGALTRELIRPPKADGRELNENEATIVAGLAYGHFLGDELTKEPGKQARYRAALHDIQRRVIIRLRDLYQEEQRPLPESLAALSDGRRPESKRLFDVIRSIPVLLSVAEGSVIAPYEIATTDDQRRRALERLSAFVHFPQERGKVVFDAMSTARKTVSKNDLSWILWTVIGGLIVITAPVGLVVAAPAGLAGGAAIVGALAAFGPGGMVGGILTATALSGVGAGVAGAGLARALASSSASPEAFEAAVAQQLATAIARAALKDPQDDTPWFVLCKLEGEVSRQQQQQEAYSDQKAASLLATRRKAEAVRRALDYMIENDLAPLDGELVPKA
jgi:pimeloyl-ACP methyl ester carboxylesterase